MVLSPVIQGCHRLLGPSEIPGYLEAEDVRDGARLLIRLVTEPEAVALLMPFLSVAHPHLAPLLAVEWLGSETALVFAPPPDGAVALNELPVTRPRHKRLGRLVGDLLHLGRFFHHRDLALMPSGLDLVYLQADDQPLMYGWEMSVLAREGQGPPTDVRYQAPEHFAAPGRRVDQAGSIYGFAAMIRSFVGAVRDDARARPLDATILALLEGMTAQTPDQRPSWDEVCAALPEDGSSLQGPVWLGDVDRGSVERMLRLDGVVALQARPGREGRVRLASLIQRAEQDHLLVLRPKADHPETGPFCALNQVIHLLRDLFSQQLNMPEVLEGLSPLSIDDNPQDRDKAWSAMMMRIAAALIPAHVRGVLMVVENLHHWRDASLKSLAHMMRHLQGFPFRLVVTCPTFAAPSFRRFAAGLKQDVHFLRPEPLPQSLDGLFYSPPAMDLAEIEDLRAKTGGDEQLFLIGMNGGADALFDHFKSLWQDLEPSEQRVLGYLVCCERALHRDTLSTCTELPNLDEVLAFLVHLGLVSRKGDIFSSSPLIQAALRRLLSANDVRVIQRGLLNWEVQANEPDAVHILFLKHALGEDTPSDHDSMLHLFLAHLDMEIPQRLSAVHEAHQAMAFSSYALLLAILCDEVLPPSKCRDLSPWAQDLAAASRARAAGKLDGAMKRARHGAGHEDNTIAQTLYALVVMLETAALLGDRRVYRLGVKRLQKLDFEQVHRRTRHALKVRLALVAAKLQAEPPFPVDDPLVTMQTVLDQGNFHLGLQPLQEAASHYAQTAHHGLRAAYFKRAGNILFRNVLTERARTAYLQADASYAHAGNPTAREDVAFNLACAENLAGHFASALKRFDKIREQARKSGDQETLIQVMTHVLYACLLSGDRERFERELAAQERLSSRTRQPLEQIRGLVLSLYTALDREREDLITRLQRLDALLKKQPIDSLIEGELAFAKRLAHFALGKPAPPPEVITDTTRRRHQFLDFLTGRTSESWSRLTHHLGHGLIGGLNGEILRAAVEKGLVRKELRDDQLARAFRDLSRRTGRDFRPFLDAHFRHNHGLDGPAGRALAQILNYLDRHPIGGENPSAMLKHLCLEVEVLFHHHAWGLFSKEAAEHKKIGRGTCPGPLKALLQDIGQLQSPHLRSLAEGSPASSALLLPIHLFGEPATLWFLADRPHKRELDQHQIALLRIYARFFEWAVALLSSETQVSKKATPSKQIDVGIVGKHPSLQSALTAVARFGPSRLNIFIWGESGTGKELTARAVHRYSDRADGPFVALNCSSFPSNLIEGELFGHVKGAYTGADEDRMGLLEQANGGTLFLDEIADISPKIQSLLLRVTQEGEYQRLGENRVRSVDIRFVTATNKNLEALVDTGAFREDLFFRIVGQRIDLPPLRERFSDLPDLVQHFAAKHARGRSLQFDPSYYEQLQRYHWPGNIRELEAFIYKTVVYWPDQSHFDHNHILPFLRGKHTTPLNPKHGLMKELLEDYKRQLILRRLNDNRGNRTRTAESLGVSRQTLVSLLNKYSVN